MVYFLTFKREKGQNGTVLFPFVGWVGKIGNAQIMDIFLTFYYFMDS